ncbi:hypothetical protein MXB_4206, partial [Myxobolus squamalis]
VFCPQTYTFAFDFKGNSEELKSNLTTLINGSLLSPDNQTSVIIMNGSASLNENQTNGNTDIVTLIVKHYI